jgi:hypothetical protein
MIEVNVKAKPFNPAESVIGSDLMLCLADAQLIGWHYFCDKPPADKGKSVMGIAGPGKYNNTLKKIKLSGWVPGKAINGGITITTKYHRTNAEGLIDTFFLIDNWDTYEKWSDAAEVCKLLGINYSEENKTMVKFIHQVIVDGFKVYLDAEGNILKVAAPPPKHHHEEAAPVFPPLGFGEHAVVGGGVYAGPHPVPPHWAAAGQAADVAGAQAAQMMAEVDAQIQAEQQFLQQAGMADNNGG